MLRIVQMHEKEIEKAFAKLNKTEGVKRSLPTNFKCV